MSEIGEVPFPIKIALPVIVADTVDLFVCMDHVWGDGKEGLGARVDGEAVLDHLWEGHRGVEKGLELGTVMECSMAHLFVK